MQQTNAGLWLKLKLMKYLFWFLITMVIFGSGCDQNSPDHTITDYRQIIIIDENPAPTIDIKRLTLITNDVSSDSINAIAILRLKKNLPLAMQKKDSSLFGNILSKDFTYRGEDEFYNSKKDYINNRIYASWTIDTVKYQNLVLRFFGNIALLTYRNTLRGTDDNGKPDIEHYSWADIYVKEGDKWKIKGIHEIESRVEYAN